MSEASGKPIMLWKRSDRRYDEEKVYGDALIRWAYNTTLGGQILDQILVKPGISKLYGWMQDRPGAQRKIDQFVQKFEINMKEFEPGPFSTFNEFFIRKYRPGARAFEADKSILPAFAEGRYFGFEKFAQEIRVPVKEFRLDLHGLIANREISNSFENGPCLIARLAPVDYHRFHFPDNGSQFASYRVGGRLDSVNPIALASRPNVLFENERQVTILETENFGKLAYIEVGALCVGKIVQSHQGKTFQRGDEKGYFLFGASTVILLGEPGSFVPDQDILEQTALGFETYIRLGERLGFTR